MKRSCLLLCLLLAVQSLRAQGGQEPSTLGAPIIFIPDTAARTVASLAQYVHAHCPTEPSMIHTLYNWVATHIRYDTDSMYHYNWSKPTATIAQTTMRRRKGVCENFAALFTELLTQCGIRAWTVTGYTKTGGRPNYSGHSWCAVQLDRTWWLCDPTWEVSEREADQWLMVAPADFLDTHIPFDPLWQLRYYPISHQAFKQGKSGNAANLPYFNYPDSLQAFFALDSLEQLETLSRRMYQAGLANSRLQLWHSYNEMKIAIIYGDKDMELYNTAVDLLNRATGIFNGFVQYRNQQFTPPRSDADMATLLQPIAGLLTDAEQHLNQMGRVVENFQYDTGAIKQRIKALAAKVQAQQAFVKQYLATAPAGRKQLFYAKL
jgi:Transglutaminase-like superfamily